MSEKKKELTNEEKTNEVLNEVLEERKSQYFIWGDQNHSPIEWLGILGEEVGEVNKAVIEVYFDKHKCIEKYKYHQYRKELIQVAAVAISMIECLDKQESRS